ncbi:MAG: hypothetical protein ACFFD4_38750 [Candidatus Odinarchaeota archaeon]
MDLEQTDKSRNTKEAGSEEKVALSDTPPYWNWSAFLDILKLLKNAELVSVAGPEGMIEINGLLGFKEGDGDEWRVIDDDMITREFRKLVMQICLAQIRITRLPNGNHLIGIDKEPSQTKPNQAKPSIRGLV